MTQTPLTSTDQKSNPDSPSLEQTYTNFARTAASYLVKRPYEPSVLISVISPTKASLFRCPIGEEAFLTLQTLEDTSALQLITQLLSFDPTEICPCSSSTSDGQFGMDAPPTSIGLSARELSDQPSNKSSPSSKTSIGTQDELPLT